MLRKIVISLALLKSFRHFWSLVTVDPLVPLQPCFLGIPSILPAVDSQSLMSIMEAAADTAVLTGKGSMVSGGLLI
jgi:hypothetical protein